VHRDREVAISLIDHWLGRAEAERTEDEASVSLARDRVRAEGARLGLPPTKIARLVNVASELAHNQLAHARDGHIALRPVVRGGIQGLEVIAADRGDGIADPARALEGRPSRAGSLGVGLAAVRELADEVDFDVRLGEGTCIFARVFSDVQTRGLEVGILGRPCDGERVSGDDAAVVREGDRLLVGVADGLGHGPLAREASMEAARVLRTAPSGAPDSVLAACHKALGKTRGAVMAVCAIDEGTRGLTIASVGNVSVHVYGFGPAKRFDGSSFVLGDHGRAPRRIVTEERRLERAELLVSFTDGVSSRASLEGDRDLLRQHPIQIAQHVLERFGGSHDDALVLVVR
jgi:anti-sigma regulatory factor (Ser/Thr protein kinase)